MGAFFNAAEIYEIGVHIEKNGEAFYALAAEHADEKEPKKFFTELAEWEQEHTRLFSQLKKQLPQAVGLSAISKADEQKTAYLEMVANAHVFVKNKDVKELVDACPDEASIVRMALEFEKDSVVAFTAMKNVIPPGQGREMIDRLIDEEIGHTVTLLQRLARLAPPAPGLGAKVDFGARQSPFAEQPSGLPKKT
jgi:rubrerythrin